jgi:hypothetical protein
MIKVESMYIIYMFSLNYNYFNNYKQITSLDIFGSILNSGNVIKFGHSLDKTDKTAHIPNDTTHWYHVINKGASNFIQ